jgi:hypothetical protein
VIAWWVAIMLCVVFQCTFIRKAWDSDVDGGTCIHLRSMYLGNALPNILTDVVIMAMAVTQLWKMKIAGFPRIELYVVFALGSLYILLPATRKKISTLIL